MTEPSPRRQVSDTELLERIAAGESLRSLGREFGVAHTTLARRLQRPEKASELRAARRRLRAQHAKERRAEKLVRKQARQHAARDRELDARRGASPLRRSEFQAWLHGRDGPRGLSSKDRFSLNDELAAEAVAAGGGVQEVIEKTGLRTRLGVYESVDPQVVQRALANDDQPRPRDPLDAGACRRLVPDPALISRRAAGESLRRLAKDYGVSPSTLSRYFARPEVAEAVRSRQLEIEEQRTKETERRQSHVALANHLASKISHVWCPVHNRRTYVRSVDTGESETRLEVVGCCDEAIAELVRWLQIHRSVMPNGVTFTPSGHAPANATVLPA